MLKKEQLLSAEEPFRPHIVMTVGVKGLEYGFHGYTPSVSGYFGSIDKCPYWLIPGLPRYKLINISTQHSVPGITMISLQNETGEPMPEHSKSITLRIKLSTGEVIEGVNLHWDEFSTSTLYGYSYSILIKKEYVGKLIGIEFAPPPLPDIYKKVKQVFTRSRKEGVVNAA